MKKQAFTLIELTVLLSVIAILLALLIPVLNNVQDELKANNCLNKFRQIGVLQACYLSNNNNQFQPFKKTLEVPLRWRDYLEYERSGSYSVVTTEQPCIWWCDAREWIPGERTVAHCWRNAVYIGGNRHLSYMHAATLRKPDETVLCVDTSFDQGKHASERWSKRLMIWTGWRHPGETANFLFTDGHAKPIEQSSISEEDMWELFDQDWSN